MGASLALFGLMVVFFMGTDDVRDLLGVLKMKFGLMAVFFMGTDDVRDLLGVLQMKLAE